jgi:hypothetical protein
MDLHHQWGSDLVLGPTGDVLPVTGAEMTRQRVLRRLLSAPQDLLFNPDYGAGLPARIGTLLDLDQIDALVRTQIAAERAVAQEPPPEVRATAVPHGVALVIRYRDRDTGQAAQVGFDVTN